MLCYRRHNETFSGAVDWTIFEADNFLIDHISMTVDNTVVSPDILKVKIVSSLGSDYDVTLRAVETAGYYDFLCKDFCRIFNGDKVNITFPNTDLNNVSITVVIGI